MKPTIKFINVYERSQEYGGSEEGGWYYQQYNPIAKPLKIKVKINAEGREVPIGRYKRIHTELMAKRERFGKYDYHGGIEVYIEDKPHQRFKRRRPYYE